jgi:hypothetical protein
MINLALLILLILFVNQIRKGFNKSYFDNSEPNWMNDENIQSDREDSL